MADIYRRRREGESDDATNQRSQRRGRRRPRPRVDDPGEQQAQEATGRFVRLGVLEDARSDLVRMYTKPSSAFKDFNPVELSERTTSPDPQFGLACSELGKQQSPRSSAVQFP